MSNIWGKYEKASAYIKKKSLVTRTDKNWNFYIGNQWVGMKSEDKSKLPLMNFIKPVIKYKVATVCQHAMTAKFSDISGNEEFAGIYDVLNDKFAQSWEKGKMNKAVWKSVKAGAIQGDSYVYWGTGSTLDTPQILINTSVLLGDENTPNIQAQPYIMIVERLSIDGVKEIAKANGISKNDIDKISTDNETKDNIINKEEVNDKVTCILYMDKDPDGVVCVERVTKGCTIEKRRRLSVSVNSKEVRGLKSYPLCNFVWEEKPNDARGTSECETLIPNQIELNKTLARRAITVKLTSFPRIAYDVNSITNPDDIDLVGAKIGVNTGNAQSINQAIAYLNTANISSDADKLFSDLLTHTRELEGAGDFAMGNIDPQRSSGSAIIAIRDQAQVPLNEQVSSLQQFVEDVALLWLDMWFVYELDSFGDMTPEQIAGLKPSVKVDVSQDNQWTKFAEMQAIDNLLANQHITIDEYAELIPVGGAIPKAKLKSVLSNRQPISEPPVDDVEPQIEQDVLNEPQ